MDKIDKYDFVELVIYDIHGIPKGRVVPRRGMERVLKNGMGLYAGLCFFGPLGEPTVAEDFAEKNNYSNACLKPIINTLTPVLPSARGKHKVGQLICFMESRDGVLDTSSPRTAAQIQLEQLYDLGFTLKSTFEIEFQLHKKGSVSEKCFQFGNINVWQEHEELILDFYNELDEIGIKLETLMPECAPGQFEITAEIADGIEAADIVARFRTAAKTFFSKRGYEAKFMTKYESDQLSNGFHFNHSLWTRNGANAALDPSDSNHLSQIGKYWVAGLCEHAPALSAFCSPSVSCYRRLHQPWAPTASNWGLHDRTATIRVKNEGSENVYFENRLPSSACSPHLVMAATVAAGIDGIKRKLPLPKPLDMSRSLPRSLEEALKCLEADAVLCQSLGNLVPRFIEAKRTFEVEPIKELGNVSDEDKFKKEFELYKYL